MNCEPMDVDKQEMDSSGYYVLIKLDHNNRRVGCRIMNADNVNVEDFWGVHCQDIYCAILMDERSDVWFKDRTHIAYLGKELKKAEIALATGGGYYQE